MPKLKKIDKKKAVTFQLVHRSQQDPLAADEKAPQRVFVLKENLNKSREQQLEEQRKYGIFFDDDFNYLQNLKDVGDNRMEWPEHVEQELEKRQKEAKIKLPSSVFASEVEEEVGMLNKAAPVSGPQLDIDPDIVAALDDDFNYSDPENQLEDNFIELANGVASDQELDADEEVELDSNFDEEDLDYNFDEEEMDDVGSLSGSDKSFKNEETKSRFTNYSMTSSVMRRNEQLTLLDRRFEKMLDSYDDSLIGALDCEDTDGYIPLNSDILLRYAEEFEESQKREHMDRDEEVVAKIKEMVAAKDADGDDSDEYVYIPVKEKEKHDCKSILSTYSNIYNRPTTIAVPKKEKIVTNKQTGIPKNVLGANKLTTKALNELNEQNNASNNDRTLPSVGAQSIISQLSVLSIRPKDETPEERRERKKKLKEYRKERRIEKKLNKEAFVEEAKRQVKISINNKNNVQGNKIL